MDGGAVIEIRAPLVIALHPDIRVLPQQLPVPDLIDELGLVGGVLQGRIAVAPQEMQCAEVTEIIREQRRDVEFPLGDIGEIVPDILPVPVKDLLGQRMHRAVVIVTHDEFIVNGALLHRQTAQEEIPGGMIRRQLSPGKELVVCDGRQVQPALVLLMQKVRHLLRTAHHKLRDKRHERFNKRQCCQKRRRTCREEYHLLDRFMGIEGAFWLSVKEPLYRFGGIVPLGRLVVRCNALTLPAVNSSIGVSRDSRNERIGVIGVEVHSEIPPDLTHDRNVRAQHRNALDERFDGREPIALGVGRKHDHVRIGIERIEGGVIDAGEQIQPVSEMPVGLDAADKPLHLPADTSHDHHIIAHIRKAFLIGVDEDFMVLSRLDRADRQEILPAGEPLQKLRIGGVIALLLVLRGGEIRTEGDDMDGLFRERKLREKLPDILLHRMGIHQNGVRIGQMRRQVFHKAQERLPCHILRIPDGDEVVDLHENADLLVFELRQKEAPVRESVPCAVDIEEGRPFRKVRDRKILLRVASLLVQQAPCRQQKAVIVDDAVGTLWHRVRQQAQRHPVSKQSLDQLRDHTGNARVMVKLRDIRDVNIDRLHAGAAPPSSISGRTAVGKGSNVTRITPLCGADTTEEMSALTNSVRERVCACASQWDRASLSGRALKHERYTASIMPRTE